MKNIETEILIDAPISKVWTVLTDFEAYSAWNPFIIHVEGELLEGSKLKVLIRPADKSAMAFKPRVGKVAAEQEFRWTGRLLLPGLFDGEHYFRLESAGESSTRLIHGENFRGLLVPVLWKMMVYASTVD